MAAMSGAVASTAVPFLPPLPESAPLPVSGLTLVRLATTLGTLAMTADLGGGGEAMAVFRDHALVVAAARRGASVIIGQEALDAIAAAPVERLRLHEIPHELAGLLGAYFLPTVIDGLPAAEVLPELFLRSFARPGRVACVIVQTAGDLGLVFLGGRETLLAYTRSSGAIGGMERLSGLLDQPDARLGARASAGPAAPRSALPRPPAPEPRVTAPPPPPPAAPPPPVTTPQPHAAPPALVSSLPTEPAPQHAHRQDALAAFLRATASGQDGGTPPPGVAAPPPAPSSPAAAADGGIELMDAVIAEARSVLGRNSARIEDVLAGVPPTPQAIEAAVRALRDRGVRLIRAEKLDEAVERILAVLRDRGVSRRS